ncbi:hypothetical protein [Chryseobacterium limigenitum]|uniref:Uncharacterized protein n=1 Tax=Chryseobacterium limigenitum TaxID=1612149 RepID=A0A1K2IL81_9FLAO|nr:hypothetical protein [Chryseobacterium limigenitum]SFZ93196.1 hypothetical protein SAMN05216324_104222 [Chryseobacterium limigenitum]
MSIHIQSRLGDYLYLAMGDCNGHKVVIAVGYTYGYADKKAKQFEEASQGTVKYIDISVVKSGDKEKCKTLKKLV